jgi:hypothetical protein
MRLCDYLILIITVWTVQCCLLVCPTTISKAVKKSTAGLEIHLKGTQMRPTSTSIKWSINTGKFRSARLKTSVQILLAPAYLIFQICDILDIFRRTGIDMIHTEAPQALIYSRFLKVTFSMM